MANRHTENIMTENMLAKRIGIERCEHQRGHPTRDRTPVRGRAARRKNCGQVDNKRDCSYDRRLQSKSRRGASYVRRPSRTGESRGRGVDNREGNHHPSSRSILFKSDRSTGDCGRNQQRSLSPDSKARDWWDRWGEDAENNRISLPDYALIQSRCRGPSRRRRDTRVDLYSRRIGSISPRAGRIGRETQTG
jgi:hypothetical protein